MRCPKCCWMACICPMTCASNLTLQGQSQFRQLNFPHPRGAAPYISSLPTQRGCSFFPPKALMEQGEPLACSQPVPYQAASLLPSYHSSSSSSTETTTNPPLTPFKPAVCSSYPNTGELNLLVTQHTCSRTSCAQSTERKA